MSREKGIIPLAVTFGLLLGGCSHPDAATGRLEPILPSVASYPSLSATELPTPTTTEIPGPTPTTTFTETVTPRPVRITPTLTPEIIRPPEVRFIGSSTVAILSEKLGEKGYSEENFPGLKVSAAGIGGAEIPALTADLDNLLGKDPYDVVVVYCGANDLDHGKTPEETFTNLKKFIAAIKTKEPGAKILIISPMPNFINRPGLPESQRKYNSQVASGADKLGIKFLDIYDRFLGTDGKPDKSFYADEIHLNASGYRIFARETGKAVRSLK